VLPQSNSGQENLKLTFCLAQQLGRIQITEEGDGASDTMRLWEARTLMQQLLLAE
jgi:hypothetical protein